MLGLKYTRDWNTDSATLPPPPTFRFPPLFELVAPVHLPPLAYIHLVPATMTHVLLASGAFGFSSPTSSFSSARALSPPCRIYVTDSMRRWCRLPSAVLAHLCSCQCVILIPRMLDLPRS